MAMEAPTLIEQTIAKPLTQAPVSATTHGRAITATLPQVQWSAAGPTLQEREVPRYEPLGVLGSGGMGDVLAARDNDIGRAVALKRLRPDLAHPEIFARFVEEVQIIGQLEHPNIPPIHDAGVDAEGYFFVMKKVEGETLEALIARLRQGDKAAHARWSFDRRLDVMRKVVEALRYAHSKGIVHRDIKPSNILVGPMGEVFLLDWGIAVRGAVTTGEAVVGTPLYMSPEQATGEELDARSDLFSLCLTFYEFLTLRHPFQELANDPSAVMKAIVAREIPFAGFVSHPAQQNVPMDIGWLLKAGLNRVAGLRYESADALAQRLDDRASGKVPVQCPITATKRTSYELMRVVNRFPRAFVAALSVGALGLGYLAVR
jgi:serine/threonine-protein kinase